MLTGSTPLLLAAAGIAEMSEEDYAAIDAAVMGFALQFIGCLFLISAIYSFIQTWMLKRRFSTQALLVWTTLFSVGLSLVLLAQRTAS